MARCRWPGFEFTAELIETKPDGTHVMRSHDVTPRFVNGSRVLVKPAEIVAWHDE
jgi:hypothetical protein